MLFNSYNDYELVPRTYSIKSYRRRESLIGKKILKFFVYLVALVITALVVFLFFIDWQSGVEIYLYDGELSQYNSLTGSISFRILKMRFFTVDKCRGRKYNKFCCWLIYADVAELADALDLGSSVNDVGVQVPSSAPTRFERIYKFS